MGTPGAPGTGSPGHGHYQHGDVHHTAWTLHWFSYSKEQSQPLGTTAPVGAQRSPGPECLSPQIPPSELPSSHQTSSRTALLSIALHP